MEVTDSGDIVIQDESWVAAISRDQLVIDREKGTIYHPIFGSANFQKAVFVDSGSEAQALKWFFYSTSNETASQRQGFGSAEFVQIELFNDGPDKPFIAVDTQNIVTGLCR